MTSKKIFAGIIALAFVVGLAVPAGAGAATAEELREQIEALQAQLADLTDQLAELEGEEPVSGACPAHCAGVTFDRSLKVGMTGDDVQCLQSLLNQDEDTQLAESGAGSPGNETSYYGPITMNAVVRFQEKYSEDVLASWGLTSGTGFFGSTSRAKANELLTGYCEDGEEPSDGEEPGDGDEGEGMLDLSLSADTAEAATIIADSSGSGNDGAQSMIPFLSVEFDNNGDSDAEVTELSFERIGVASDTDLSQLYLYDGDTKLAEYNSFDDKVVTFSDSGGLFEVEDGEEMTVTLKGDLADDTSGSRTIGFKVDSADSVVSDAESVSGDFPIEGNLMTTTTVSDLGRLDVATSSYNSSPDPGETNYDLWEFTLEATDQDMEVSYLKFTNVGSIDDDDLTNIKLVDANGTQYGETYDELENDVVEFDLSDNPIEVGAGDKDYYYLKGDIVGGTDRTYRFTFQNMSDVVAYDTEYGVYVKPNQADSWTIVQAGGTSTIQTGSLTISRSSDSPAGNIAQGATGIEMARFDLTATGERIKITSLDVYVTRSTDSDSDNEGLDNVKLYLDGSQKDTTRDITGDGSGNATTFSFGNTFIVDEGETSELVVKADVKDANTGTSLVGSDNNDGGDIDADDTVQIHLASGTTNYQKMTSMGTDGTPSSSGLTLTVKAGALSTAMNTAVPNASASVPTGVPGATEVMTSSFVITAGAGEGVNISSFAFSDSSSVFDEIQNVKVKTSDGTQIGNTKASVTGGNTYTFYASPKISLDAAEQLVVYVYADILTGANTGDVGDIDLGQVTATGAETGDSASANTSGSTDGQQIYISSTASMTVDSGPDMPVAAMLLMGSTDEELAEYEFYETTGAEDVTITDITLGALSGGSATATSGLLNIDLYEGDTLLGSAAYVDSSGEMSFSNLDWTIPAGEKHYLTVKSDVNVSGAVGSDTQARIQLDESNITARGDVSGTSLSLSGTNNGNAFEIWKAVPKITTSGVSLDGSGNLTNGTNDLYKFQITATGGPVEFYKWVFTYSTQNVTAGSSAWKLYNNTEGQDEDSSCTASAGTVTCIATNGEEIGEGSTETYTLKNTNVSGVGTANETESISTYLTSDSSDSTTYAAASVSGNIVWSDESNTSHSTSTSDWTNGYLLESDDEYTDKQTVSP